MEQLIYTNKDGSTKYFKTYQGAWNRCIKLNETAVGGTWYFEGNTTGWYCHFVKEEA